MRPAKPLAEIFEMSFRITLVWPQVILC